MICLLCDSESFRLNKSAAIEQEYQGSKFTIVTPAYECSKCGWRTLGFGQVDAFLRKGKEIIKQIKEKNKIT